MLARLEFRQKISLGSQLELMSIFQPYTIGPNLKLLLEMVRELEFRQFLCACSSMFKDEQSFLSHSNCNHRVIVEYTSQFTDVYD